MNLAFKIQWQVFVLLQFHTNENQALQKSSSLKEVELVQHIPCREAVTSHELQQLQLSLDSVPESGLSKRWAIFSSPRKKFIVKWTTNIGPDPQLA